MKSHATIIRTIDREAPETRLLRHIDIYHIPHSTRPTTYHIIGLTSFLPHHHDSDTMSSSFDPYASGCSPGNSSCNYNVGSINPFEGDVEYDFYGYNIQLYTAAIFVASYGLATRESLMVVIFHRTSLMNDPPMLPYSRPSRPRRTFPSTLDPDDLFPGNPRRTHRLVRQAHRFQVDQMGSLGGWFVGEQSDGVHGPDRGVDLFASVFASGLLYRFGEDHPGLGVRTRPTHNRGSLTRRGTLIRSSGRLWGCPFSVTDLVTRSSILCPTLSSLLWGTSSRSSSRRSEVGRPARQ